MELRAAYAGECLVPLTKGTGIWEEGTSAETMPPPDWPVGNAIGHFLD